MIRFPRNLAMPSQPIASTGGQAPQNRACRSTWLPAIILEAVVLCVILSASVYAQPYAQPRVAISAQPAIGIPQGEPTVVLNNCAAYDVLLTNEGAAARLTLTARPISHHYASDPEAGYRAEATVELPAGSKKVVTLFLPPLSNMSGVHFKALYRNAIIAETTIDSDARASSSGYRPQIALVSPRPLPNLANAITAAEWPDFHKNPSGTASVHPLCLISESRSFCSRMCEFAGLNMVILVEPNSLNLSSTQQSALTQWVACGGRLIIMAANSKSMSQSSAFDWPESLIDAGALDSLPEQEYGAPAAIKRNVGAIKHVPAVGRMWITGIGRGSVTLWKTDEPCGSPSVCAAVPQTLKECIVRANKVRQIFPKVIPPTPLTYKAIPEFCATPNWYVIVLLMIGYVALIGPVNWTYCLRAKRPVAYVYITTALALAATALLASYAYYVRGNHNVQVESGTVYLRSGQSQVSWYGCTALYSSSSGRNDLRFTDQVRFDSIEEDDAINRPDTVFGLGTNLELQNLSLAKWALSEIMYQCSSSIEGTIQIARQANQQVLVSNSSDIPLNRCRLYENDSVSQPFDLMPKSTRLITISQPFSSLPPTNDAQLLALRDYAGHLQDFTDALPDTIYMLGVSKKHYLSTEWLDAQAIKHAVNYVIVSEY